MRGAIFSAILRSGRVGAGILALIAFALAGAAAAAPGREVTGGQLDYYVFATKVGTESYSRERAADGEVLRVQATYDFRAQARLDVTLAAGKDLAPIRFEAAGDTLPWFEPAAKVVVGGGRAEIVGRDGARRSLPRPPVYFTASGPLPLAVQMQLVRYWRLNGRPASIPLLGGGAAAVRQLPDRAVTAGGVHVALHRYKVSGLSWGRSMLWEADDGRLVAAVAPVTADQLVAAAPDFLEAVPEFLAQAAQESLEAAKAQAPPAFAGGTVALVGGRLVDGTGRAPVEDAVVLVRDGLILAAGARSAVAVPAGARILDVKGKTVLPGLWEMHAHMKQAEMAPAYLAAGVTTVRDMGNDLEFAVALKRLSASALTPAPRMLLGGFIDGPRQPPFTGYGVATPEEARALVRRYRAAGFDQIKIWNDITPPLLEAICREARSLGLKVTGHIPHGMTVDQALDAGLDQINHASFILDDMPDGLGSPHAKALLDRLARQHVVVDTTLVVQEFGDRNKALPLTSIEPGAKYAPPDVVAMWSRFGVPADEAQAGARRLRDILDLAALMHRSGITLVAGSDGGVPAYTLLREIELYVQAGIPAMDAIRAATAIPAEVMGEAAQAGTVEPGKRADLLVVDGDPLRSIGDIRRAAWVMKGGAVYDPATLWRAAGFKAP